MKLISGIFKLTDTTIRGEAKGEIMGAANIVVTSTGYCEATIKAKRLEISGVVKGDIEVDNLVIRKKGQLNYGKLSYKNLILDNGGVMSPSSTKVMDINSLMPPKALPVSESEVATVTLKEPRFYNSY